MLNSGRYGIMYIYVGKYMCLICDMFWMDDVGY